MSLQYWHVHLMFLGFLLVVVGYYSSPSLLTRLNDQQECSRETQKWIKIFVFTPIKNKYSLWERLIRRIVVGQCPETRCLLLSNLTTFHEADAVLFSAMDLPHREIMNAKLKSMKLTSKIRAKQIWILVSLNPPSDLWTMSNLSGYNNFFNWIMSYQTNSDIWSPFGMVLPRNIKFSNKFVMDEIHPEVVPYSSPDFYESKNNIKLGLSIISSCRTDSNRKRYLRELERTIKIDSYGKCYKNILGATTRDITIITPDKVDETESVIPNYFFYMAFEKSICDDFLTEHFYRALKLGAVPVILGSISNDTLAPPNSYIDASRFGSPRKLANYLKKIAKNKEKYLSYHKWRKDFTISMGYPYNVFSCDLCSKLHQRDRKVEIIHNIASKFPTSSCHNQKMINHDYY